MAKPDVIINCTLMFKFSICEGGELMEQNERIWFKRDEMGKGSGMPQVGLSKIDQTYGILFLVSSPELVLNGV